MSDRPRGAPTEVAETGEVADLRRRVAELTEINLRLKQTIDNLDVGLALRSLDPPGVLYLSPRYKEIYGLGPEEEMTRETGVAATFPEDRERIQRDYLDQAQALKPASIDLQIVRRDGAVRWIHLTSRPVANPDGSVTLIAGTIEDITARKETEAALHQAQRRAQHANNAKSEFLSAMSHELRTPLNAIIGFSQVLGFGELAEGEREAVDHVLRAGRHLLEMINDVLDIARIETDELDLSLEPVNVGETLEECVALARPAGSPLGVTVTLEAGRPDLAQYVHTDRRRLKQILINLLSNAVKYNVEGGEVHVTCTRAAADRLAIAVRDTGRGMSPSQLTRLFTPFERLGVHDVDGVGIGLALSRQLAQAMGATIDVDSAVGAGTTFTLTLPRATDTSSSDPARPSGELARVVPGAPSVVLYIEDNLPNVRLVQRLLDWRPGWTLVHAHDGSSGLQLAAALPRVDLVLLDLHLPDIGGAEVLAALTRLRRLRGAPVVVVSADANQARVSEMLAAGAAGYLTKPFDATDVLHLLDQHRRSGSGHG